MYNVQRWAENSSEKASPRVIYRDPMDRNDDLPATSSPVYSIYAPNAKRLNEFDIMIAEAGCKCLPQQAR